MSEEQRACSAASGDRKSSPAAASKLQGMMIENNLAKIKHRLLIMSGKGGVGKSSLAANMAVGLANKGLKVGLLDVDFHGPSIANIMGLQGLLDVDKDKFATPKTYGDNLKIVSMQSLLSESDKAVIWRGPVKTGVIRQFIADVRWDALDFLVIDSPPGTGDEHLSIAEVIPDVKSVVITTPQEVALSDVRKSISFCRTVNMEIIGLIENMGPFPCPCCGKTLDPFKTGGGEKTAKTMGVRFLGTIPFDPNVVTSSDSGVPFLSQNSDSGFSRELNDCIDRIIALLDA
jgi:ATP-binding protein involved in chromosome partitioning